MSWKYGNSSSPPSLALVFLALCLSVFDLAVVSLSRLPRPCSHSQLALSATTTAAVDRPDPAPVYAEGRGVCVVVVVGGSCGRTGSGTCPC